MTTALGAAPAAAGLAFNAAALGDDRVLGAVAPTGPAARPVLVLLDASGSLAGPPLAEARRFVERLAPALGGRPLAVAAAAGDAPALLRAFGPAPAEAPLPPIRPAGRADLRRAAALVRAEATCAAGGVGAIDLVVVSDLALGARDVEALRALEREGARLHLVLAPGPRPARAGLDPHVRLGDGDAAASLLARLGPASDDRLVVSLARLPRAWFAWRGGDALEGGAPASLARLERPLGDRAVAFVLDRIDGEATLGEAWLAPDRRLTLDLSRAGAADAALVEAVRRATEGGTWGGGA